MGSDIVLATVRRQIIREELITPCLHIAGRFVHLVEQLLKA
jgi:hypothetical protein